MVPPIMQRNAPHVKPRVRRRVFCAAALLLQCIVTAGCAEGRGPFAALDLPETRLPPETPWPRLVDVPAPESLPAPQPEAGREIARALKREAAVAAVAARTLEGPVVEPEEAARLTRR